MPKLYIYAAIFFVFIGFIYWYSDRQYDAGYNEAKAKYEQEKKEALETAIKESNDQSEKDSEILKANIIKLNELKGKYDDLKIKASTANICEPDFIKLYNDSIRETNQR